MNRILLGMAGMTYLLLAITIYLGILSEPHADASRLGDGPFRYHFSMGIFTVLFTVLTYCLVFTYFLGTNRWVRETAAAYQLPESYALKSRQCRMRAFTTALIGILLAVATVASGAGAHTRTWPLWVHWLIPATTYIYSFFAFTIEYHALEQHMQLTDEVMVEVQRIRAEMGYPAEPASVT